jgi:hypothetical protein
LPDLARQRKIQQWAELRAKKTGHGPSCTYSTIFLSNWPFLPGFSPEIRAFGSEIVPPRKKFPQHFLQKLLIFLTLPREAFAAAPL